MYQRLAVLLSMMWVVFTVNTAAAKTWSAEELVTVIQQAQADGQPVPQRVAEKIHAELAKSGFQIVDGQLVAQTDPTATGNSLEVLAALDPAPGAQQRLETMFQRPFPITLQLPPVEGFIHDTARQALMDLVLDYLYNKTGILGEFALDVIRDNWEEVLYYVLTDNSDGLAQLFTAEKLCPSLLALKAVMLSGPLYSKFTGACLPVDARAPGPGPYFATPSCATEISFQIENFPAFCREAFTSQPNPLLGNPKAWPTVNVEVDPLSTLPDVSSKWSLSSGAQLAIGVESITGNHIPFMKRFNFRQAGSCELEMRVYKKDIAATNLTPLLWIHGGAWKYRGAGFVGLESLVSNYTEDNFIVFAPFYRLAGNKDGNVECRNAPWTDLVADAEAALDWVKANGASLGADTSSSQIPVTGQSAGGHLAGWLMTHRAPDVSRGLLVYPPTDLYDFLTRLQGVGGASFPPLSDAANTPYDPSSAEDILETFLQLPDGGARTIDLNNPPPYVTENSFARIIGANPSAYPPAFIMHGTRDSLLTYTQSEVLCEAYGGSVNVDWSTADLRAIFPCGAGSQLHLFEEAEHAFEVCPAPATSSVCRAGSPASAALLVDSLQQARRWLLNVDTPPGSLAPGTPATINVPRTSFNGRFTVSWATATGTVTHYELYESKDRTFAAPGVLAYRGPDTSVSLSRSNGTYYYQVRACNNDLCSGYQTGSNGVAVFRLRF